jgi:methyltransferase (TIGR00027 family)
MWVAAMRGVAALDDPAIVSDSFAADLLPPRYRALLRAAQRAPRVSRAILRGAARVSQNVARHLAMRTRAIDDVVSREARAGTKQLVLLGAGLDARAWRLDALDDAIVFEIDHPDTQALKRSAIGERTPRAKEVRWAPIDFSRETHEHVLEQVLERVGHDRSQRTTFVWEGVTMYLASDAIDETLDAIARLSAPGSCVAVTYHDAMTSFEILPLTWMVRAVGEPFKTRMTRDDVRARFAARGFAIESDEGTEDWSPRYVGESGRASGERLAIARCVSR